MRNDQRPRERNDLLKNRVTRYPRYQGEFDMAEQLARRAAQAARENADSTSDEIAKAEWLTTAHLWDEIADGYARYGAPSSYPRADHDTVVPISRIAVGA
jgi:hypothetical protein